MVEQRPFWLVHNKASGSNDRAALQRVRECTAENGLRLAYRSAFPGEDLPTAVMLDAAQLDLVVIYAGDGTVNAVLDSLSGWSGQLLVLPGGTMNLLYHRLFAQLEQDEVVRLVGNGEITARRPGIIASDLGNAYAGLLAGPGTSWNDVREAMRNVDVIGMASETKEAFVRTLSDVPLRVREPELGRREGYPLLLLEPHDERIEVYAYHAESSAEFIEQLLALAQRDFRQGPHDCLGNAQDLTLASVDEQGFGVLLDGEPAEADGPTTFRLSTCGVDLLALPRDD